MDLFSSIAANSYSSIYLYLVFFCCCITSLYYVSSTKNNLAQSNNYALYFPAILLSLFLIIFLGGRPEKGFGDTWGYTIVYNSYANATLNDVLSGEKEIFWCILNWCCNSMGFSATDFFILIEALYIGLMFLCCFILMRNNIWVAMLFCLVSFSFYGYAVNGIRNGLACSIILVAIALFSGSKIRKCFALLLFLAAYSIHNSTALPIICIIGSLFFIKEPKYAIYFWLLSIIVSLIAGNIIGDFFANLGFDDRTSYFEDLENADISEIKKFSKIGFRYDFLLYSSMPVLMVWYMTIKRNFKDFTYYLVANTYILSNAFWIMIIRATYSNRFAYLSWFLYPIIIAYPLIRFNVWVDQDRKTALILLAYSGFTFVMFLLGQS